MRLAPLSALALALGLFLGTAAVRAEDAAPAAATGTITGKVVDKDGKAVKDAEIRVAPATAKKSKGAATGLAAEGKKGKGGGAKGPAIPAVKTDDTGSFKIDVPAGTYNVMAKTADGLVGKSLAPVVVEAGKTVDAGSITVAAKAGKKG